MVNQTVVSKVSIRPIEFRDNQSVREFMESVPDGGKVAFQPRYKIEDIYHLNEMQKPDTQGFVSYLAGVSAPVGIIYAWPHKLCYGEAGEIYQGILLNSLSVHHNYRQQGIARALLNEVIKWANANFGAAKLIIYGYIQAGNTASEVACTKAGGQLTGRVLFTVPAKVLSKASTAGVVGEVREATEADLAKVVAGLNSFYRGHDFYRPQTVTSLSSWLSRKEIEGQVLELAKYYVAMDAQGEIQAGMGVWGGTALYDLQVTQMPQVLKLLNKGLKVVAPDGFLSPLPVSRTWYNPGQLELAKVLWREVRYRESSRGRTLVASFDPTGLLKPLFRPRSIVPASKLQLVMFQKPSGVTGARFLAGYES